MHRLRLDFDDLRLFGSGFRSLLGGGGGLRSPASSRNGTFDDELLDNFRYGDKGLLEDFMSKHRGAMGTDIDEQPVFLAKSSWDVGYAVDRNPNIRFERSKERA